MGGNSCSVFWAVRRIRRVGELKGGVIERIVPPSPVETVAVVRPVIQKFCFSARSIHMRSAGLGAVVQRVFQRRVARGVFGGAQSSDGE